MKNNKPITAWIIALILLSAASGRAQIPTNGLVLYLQGNVGVEEAIGDSAENGDGVVRWLDQSSAGNNVATNGFAGTTTPTYLTNVVNGQSAVKFGDTSTERLLATTPLITGTTDFSIFAVIQPTDVASVNYIAGNFGIVNNQGLEFYVHQATLKLYIGNLGISVIGSAFLPNGNWYLVQAEKSGSTYTLRVNNVLDGSSTTTPGFVGAIGNWSVGNGPDYSSEDFDGNIGAHLVYNRALTAEEHSFVVNRLADDFGIQGVPEPSAMALLSLGGVLLWRRRIGVS